MHAEGEPTWLATLAETVPVGIVAIDAAGTVVWCNGELQRQFGYRQDQLVGQGIEHLLPARFRDQHLSLRSHYIAAPAARPMGTGRELRGLRSDGTEFPLEIGLRPLEVSGGKLFVATVVDATSRHEAQASLRRVIEAAPCGMLVVDHGQRIVLANQLLLATFGYGPSELIGRTLEVLVPDRHRAEHQRHVGRFLADPAARAMGPGLELTGLHSDGTEFPVEIGLQPVELHSGPCVLATVIDVTERKRVEQHLRRVNADLEEFAYAASHDLRSPLRAIGDLGRWIAEELEAGATPSVRRNLDRLQLRTQRMDALVGSLLDYARAGAEQGEQQAIDVGEWLREQFDMQDASAGRVRFRVESALLRIKVSTTPLSSVLQNLIANAIAHNDSEAPEVVIGVKSQGAYYRFDVTDNGPGVGAEFRERIFKLFQRLSRDKQGSGIGLAMVKRIVETHGGQVEVGDRPDGVRGAVFTVLWPQSTRRKDLA